MSTVCLLSLGQSYPPFHCIHPVLSLIPLHQCPVLSLIPLHQCPVCPVFGLPAVSRLFWLSPSVPLHPADVPGDQLSAALLFHCPSVLHCPWCLVYPCSDCPDTPFVSFSAASLPRRRLSRCFTVPRFLHNSARRPACAVLWTSGLI